MPDPSSVRVIHRDRDLLVLDKPSGLATTSPDGKNCLAALARELDPDAPRMHPSSRLDAEVTGVVTFARSDRAIAALLAARKAGRYERCYVALAAQPLAPASGEWRWAIGKDPREARSRVALDENDARGTFACSRYEVVASSARVTLLRLFPQTGRTHQLRVHAARAGIPLFGDKPYGGATRVVLDDGRVVSARRVMLHCSRVTLPRIAGEGTLELRAPLHDDMRALYAALGGAPGDLDAL